MTAPRNPLLRTYAEHMAGCRNREGARYIRLVVYVGLIQRWGRRAVERHVDAIANALDRAAYGEVQHPRGTGRQSETRWHQGATR